MLNALFPELCPGCGGSTGAGFCATCASLFSRVANPCPRCGLELPVGGCSAHGGDWHLATVIAPYRYAAPLDHYVHALKYRRARRLGRALALLIAPSVQSVASSVDALVPVPLHAHRLRERGFNQATEIARVLAREYGRPLLAGGITRAHARVPQSDLGASDRRANVAGAFAVTAKLTGLRVALVDDVITTGATVSSLAGALRAAGAAHVEAWAVARTL